ncbi:MAG: hypothetical protein ABI886_17340, partial [Betaproteobacteria bacterium]
MIYLNNAGPTLPIWDNGGDTTQRQSAAHAPHRHDDRATSGAEPGPGEMSMLRRSKRTPSRPRHGADRGNGPATGRIGISDPVGRGADEMNRTHATIARAGGLALALAVLFA